MTGGDPVLNVRHCRLLLKEIAMAENIDSKRQSVREELDKLNYEYKVEIPKRIAEARAYGDLKENAEYHAARERQGFVKARISQLNAQLRQMKELDLNSIADDRIGFGASVTVLDLDTNERIELALVSPDSIDPSAGRISLSSPIGIALQNKQAGEEVAVAIPAGKRNYYIEKIVTIQGNIFEKKFGG
jgi:transcription elongation factor GreA